MQIFKICNIWHKILLKVTSFECVTVLLPKILAKNLEKGGKRLPQSL